MEKISELYYMRIKIVSSKNNSNIFNLLLFIKRYYLVK